MPKETTLAITLQTHNPYTNWSRSAIGYRRGKYGHSLSQWDKLLCRHFLGPRYNKPLKRDLRQSGYAFPEKFHVSPHYHLIIDIKNWDKEEYIAVATRTWLELVRSEKVNDPSQTFVKIIPIYGTDWEWYSSKDWKISEPDSWIPIPYVEK